MPWPTNRRIIGTKVPRIDAHDKATGRAKYSYDINRPGMLHAKILRCPHAHAKVKTIDATPASAPRISSSNRTTSYTSPGLKYWPSPRTPRNMRKIVCGPFASSGKCCRIW